MKVKALLSGLSRSLIKVLEVKMSRLLLSSVFVALMAGLTLLACVIPLEPEWIPNIGDELQITEGSISYFDPCWFASKDSHQDGEYFPMNLQTARIVYHDRRNIYLHDMLIDTDEVYFTAPDGYTINSIDTFDYCDILLTLSDGTHNVISYLKIDPFTFEYEYGEIYRDEISSVITSAFCSTYGYGRYFNILCERDDGNFYHISVRLYDDTVLYNLYHGGYDIVRSDQDGYDTLFVAGEPPQTVVYGGRYTLSGDDFQATVEPLYSGDDGFGDGHYRCPDGRDCVVFYTGEEPDIWDAYGGYQADGYQITDKPGFEKELDSTDKYIVFSREVDDVSNIHVVRRK